MPSTKLANSIEPAAPGPTRRFSLNPFGIVLLIIVVVTGLLIGLKTFLNHQAQIANSNKVYRLIDHLNDVTFVETPLAEFLSADQGRPNIPASAENEMLKKLIAENLNKDYVASRAIHPFNLKLTISSRLNGSRPGLRTQNVLLAPPETIFTVDRPVTDKTVLTFGYALINWENMKLYRGIVFQIVAEDLKTGSQRSIFQAALRPDMRRQDRGFQAKRIELKEFAGHRVRFTFKTTHPKGWDMKSLLAVWSNPTFFQAVDPGSSTNLILISVDTLRSDHLGSYGYRRNTTPAIDQLAKKGVLFKHAISQAPYTMSSHMSILTSLYPSFHNINRLRESLFDSKHTTLTEILYNEGFQTWAIVGGGQVSYNYGFAEGFENFTEYTYKQDLEDKLAETVDFLEREKGSRFFIFFHTFRPHAPYLPQPPYDTMFDPDYKGEVDGQFVTLNAINNGSLSVSPRDIEHIISLYDGEIRQTDDALGKFFEYLEKKGLASNTLIVFTSDHGEEFGEHGRVGIHSHTLFDELLRVPLIMKFPGVLPAGKVIEQQVQSVDILPTILDLLKIPISPHPEFQGISLVDQIFDRSSEPPRTAFSERLAVDDIILRSMRTQEDKFIYEEDRKQKTNNFYQFSLRTDPLEQNNIAMRTVDASQILPKFQFLVQQERVNARIPRKQNQIDEETKETLKALGYVN